MCLKEQILHCYRQTVFLPWRNLLCTLPGVILKGLFYRSKDMTRIFKMLSGVGFGKVFRMKILNPIAALFFLFPKNIKWCVYFTGNRTVEAEHGHWFHSTWLSLWDSTVGHSIPMGQCTAGASRDHATPEAEKWQRLSRKWVLRNHLLPTS